MILAGWETARGVSVPENNDEGFSSDDEEDIAWKENLASKQDLDDVKISQHLTGKTGTSLNAGKSVYEMIMTKNDHNNNRKNLIGL